jgi:hypothetical protein
MVGEGKEADGTALAWKSPPYGNSISDREQPVSLLTVLSIVYQAQRPQEQRQPQSKLVSWHSTTI